MMVNRLYKFLNNNDNEIKLKWPYCLNYYIIEPGYASAEDASESYFENHYKITNIYSNEILR